MATPTRRWQDAASPPDSGDTLLKDWAPPEPRCSGALVPLTPSSRLVHRPATADVLGVRHLAHRTAAVLRERAVAGVENRVLGHLTRGERSAPHAMPRRSLTS
jgi:hypothetical protein